MFLSLFILKKSIKTPFGALIFQNLGRGSPHQPNWLFWECKPTYIAENKTYLTLNDKITIFPYFSSVKIGIIYTCSDHTQPLYQI